MKANYHTHTVRCQHAAGTDESYVVAALESGFEELGFSDHAPWPFRTGFVSGIRMDMDSLNGYLQALRALRLKYAGQLRLRIGLEAEWFRAYPEHPAWLLDHGVEYLILGQHYSDTEEKYPYAGSPDLDDDGVLFYAETVAEALATGLYRYLCHPDLFMRWRPAAAFSAACERAADMICQAALENGVPLEFNLLGLRNRQVRGASSGYPNPAFWQYIAKYPVETILGVDAHDPAMLRDAALWAQGVACLKGLGRQPLDRLEF